MLLLLEYQITISLLSALDLDQLNRLIFQCAAAASLLIRFYTLVVLVSLYSDRAALSQLLRVAALFLLVACVLTLVMLVLG